MNTRSNLAYDHSMDVTYPIGTTRTASNVRIKINKKTKTKVASRTRAMGIFKVFLIVLCAFTVLYRGLMITDRCSAIEEKKADIEALVTTNEKLQYEIDRSLDLKKVEATAQNELGMRRADKHQTVYVNLEQTDYVEKVAGRDVEAGGKMTQFFHTLLAYLD